MGGLAVFKKDFFWDKKRITAAQLMAEGELTLNQIATRLKVDGKTVRTWSTHPDFAAEVRNIVQDFAKFILGRGIANKLRRLERANDRWQRMNLIIEERAKDPDMKGVPGGKSGLLVKDIKRIEICTIGEDEKGRKRKSWSKQDLATYAVDTGLLSEIRQLEAHVAKELGQLQGDADAGQNLRGLPAVDASEDRVDLGKIPIEDLESLQRLMAIAKPDALEFEADAEEVLD